MKKLLMSIALAGSLFLAGHAVAYTVVLDIDDSMELVDLQGFQFDFVGVTPGDVTFVQESPVPMMVSPACPWETKKTTGGFYGLDLTDGATVLSAGTVITMIAETPFTLDNCVLASLADVDGAYPYEYVVVVDMVGDGATYTLTAESPGPVVPIPASVFLLSAGLLGLLSVRRRT